MSTATIFDYYRRRNEIRQMFPDDLLEDIQDKEPAIYEEALLCDRQIANYKRQLKESVAPIALLPSILTEGWDEPKENKYTINWPDMENLLKLYALGLYFKDQPLSYQAEHDQSELTNAVERASISPKHKKGISAQKRLEKATTYLRFGLRTLDAFFQPDPSRRHFDMADLDAEIRDTQNEHNAAKLGKSKGLALKVGRLIQKRYQTEHE